MATEKQKLEPREIRRKTGLNQSQFWSKIGVTQSGGSRYESGRKMPNSVQTLLNLIYIEDVDLAKVNKSDFDVAQYLKASDPELYKQLKKAATVKAKAKKK